MNGTEYEEMDRELGNDREWGNGKRMRKRKENEEMERDSFSQFLILSLLPPYLSISSIKICHNLLQTVKHSTFVANVAKNLTYTRYKEMMG